MKAYPITDRIHALHVDIRGSDLFEGIWPIPDGVSLNSYVVRGEKTALIDLVRDWTDAPAILGDQLSQTGSGISTVDYLVLNHLEPDHTGWLAEFRALNPHATIYATAKGIELVKSFYKITDGLVAVKTGDTLDLGAGMVLHFIEAPNVHWPETMITYEPASGVAFTCDAFGGFGALGDRVFDDQFDAEEHSFFERESLRYYANIVSSFGLFVKKAIEKISLLDVRVVAPSHGIIWRKNPAAIVERYAKYADYLEKNREKHVCVVWGSMYGNTEKGLKAVLAGLDHEKVPYSLHRVPDEDVSFALADAYKSEGIVVAMPTYEYKMFPPVSYLLELFERKHVWNRVALRIGSWGWVGGAKKDYEAKIAPLKWLSLESVEWAGGPDAATLDILYERGRELGRRVKGA
jgi:flavorubredoxin